MKVLISVGLVFLRDKLAFPVFDFVELIADGGVCSFDIPFVVSYSCGVDVDLGF